MIAIKGMEELPKNCAECSLVTDDMFGDATCVLLCDEWKDNKNHRAENCPLVEIITCKDCKHKVFLASDNEGNVKYMCDKHCKNITNEDYFCADGERRE